MAGPLVNYDSSSSSSDALGNKKLKPTHTTCEESEVSSSVVQEKPKEITNQSTMNPVTLLIEMGCSFEQTVHAISVCGQDTQVEDLFDFIQACEYPLNEGRNTHDMPVQEENVQMQQSMEMCPSPLHIIDSCGSREKGKLFMETQGYTEEASCSRSRHVGEPFQHADQSTSTLRELESMGFTPVHVQRASEECNSIDFDVLLEYLLQNKEVDSPYLQNSTEPQAGELDSNYRMATPLQRLQGMGYNLSLIQKASEECNSIDFDVLLNYLIVAEEDNLQDQMQSEVDSSENEDCEAGSVSKLRNMDVPYSAITKAIDICGSHDFDVLLDVLNASEKLKDKRVVDGVKGSRQQVTLGESTCANFLKNKSIYAEEGLISKPGVIKWTGNMEKLWCSYTGIKKKNEPPLRSDTDDSETEIFESTWQDRPLKSSKGKRKLEFHECKQVEVRQQGKMMGFGIPGLFIGRPKTLPYLMRGPPFFYFENVASVPNKEWDTIKRHFNGVDPEFTDSKFFSASRRPRGYVHNLPIEGRTLLPYVAPMTISEALPETQHYWPSWDRRDKLNCINTRKAPDSLCRLIRTLFALHEQEDMPYQRQQEIVQACKKWNLVWVGPGQVAPLEPHEIELLLGFDRDHTRGCSSMTDRYDALGNSFQVQTVAYHLSTLKSLYPDGITVLSLFSGIGGAEVALDKLGVYLKVVIAVEINEKVRGVLASWWRKSGQRGELKLKNDVRDLTHDVLADLVDEVGPIDLIIGGSPCNNLSGNNRVSRIGLNGSESSLFFEFPRILNIVTQVMRGRGFL